MMGRIILTDEKSDPTNPAHHGHTMREALDLRMAKAKRLGMLLSAVVVGRATLGDTNEYGEREIIQDGVGTGAKVDQGAARQFGITDWTEERELRDDTVL